MCGGEQLPSNLVERVRELNPELRVINHYGPTETSVGVLAGQVPIKARTAVPSLGRPLAHVTAAVQETQGAQVPIGDPGELVIAGASVALGYLGNPRLTADRFRPFPDGAPGGRAYHTGDLVRISPSGDIQYLSRADDQVKVRGWRVEPGEIEALLGEHRGVTQACVVAVPANRGTFLAAFVSAREGVTRESILEYLQANFPDPLVPGQVEFIDRFPLLPNGKVDRRQLRDLALEAPSDGITFRDDVEFVLSFAWSELIGVSRIDVTADLFKSGAHSLMAMQALSRLRQLFDLPLQLESFFEWPTIEGYAAHLNGGSHGDQVRRRAAVVARALRMTDQELDAENPLA